MGNNPISRVDPDGGADGAPGGDKPNLLVRLWHAITGTGGAKCPTYKGLKHKVHKPSGKSEPSVSLDAKVDRNKAIFRGSEMLLQSMHRDLLKHLDDFHLNTTLQIKDNVEYKVDFEEDETDNVRQGHTTNKVTPGAISVFIHPGAFVHKFQLYLVVGHELIHVIQASSGQYDKWDAAHGKDGAKIIADYHAYEWQAAEERKLGYFTGASKRLDTHRRMLPPAYKAKLGFK